MHVGVLLGALEEPQRGGAISRSGWNLDRSVAQLVRIGGYILSIHGNEQKGDYQSSGDIHKFKLQPVVYIIYLCGWGRARWHCATMSWRMKIATYNVNSIRRRLPIVLDWLSTHQPDVFCLQETKVQDSEFPADAIRDAGYHASFRGMKGYNGVATLTKGVPDKVIHGLHEGSDNEDFRIIQTVVNGIPIINSYVPQGHSITSEKYALKIIWFRRLQRYFAAHLDPAKPALWVGDLNVAPEAIDVYHPGRRVNDPDFHVDARTAFKEAVAWGFIDVFRRMHPDRVQYTYWDYFRSAFRQNFGWRIDHILATAPLAVKCVAVDVDVEPRKVADASDHTVVWADFNL